MAKTRAELIQENLEKDNEIKSLRQLVDTLSTQLKVMAEQLKHNNEEMFHLKATIQSLTDRITLLLQRKYGSSSERMKDTNPYQMSLFGDEPKPETVPEVSSEEAEGQAAPKAATKKKRTRNPLPKGAKEIKTVIGLPEEEQYCSKHPGVKLVEAGEVFVRTVVHYKPAELFIEHIYKKVYRCQKCAGENGFNLVNAKVPSALLPHSRLTASLAAHVLTQKFVMGLPFYRQVMDFSRMGYELESRDMSNWVMALDEYYFQYITDYLHKELLKTDVIHADETPFQVHREDGRKDTSESYLWMYGTGTFEEGHPIRMFSYCPGRSGDFAKEFLKGFKGTLITDQYAGYNKVEGVTHAGCLDHLRRQFVNAQKCAKDKKDAIASEAITKLGKLYAIEAELKDSSPEDRKKERQAKAKDIAEDFFEWLEKVRPGVAPKSKTGKAISYALNGKATYLAYLDNGKVCMTNSPAERAIRPIAVGRKNWLFCGSPRGARACASCYSIVETCRANGVDPRKYLNYILERMPQEGNLASSKILEKYMPWNEDIQKNCKV